jgi:hypothetical protein
MANSCTVTISGEVVQIIEGSLQIKSRVDDKDTCTFTVRDDSGTLAFTKGQAVRVTDSQLGLLFSGFINKPTCTNLYPNATNLWSIDCVNKFIVTAKKATVRKTSTGKWHRGGKHKNQHSGAIAALQIQEYIEPEGVTGNFGLDWSELQTDWQMGTQTGVAAATNTSTGNEGAGDLELAPAGIGMTFVQQTQADFQANPAIGMVATSNGVTLSPTQAIMVQATCGVPGLTNGSTYVKIWSGSYTIAMNDTLYFDVWIASTSPQQKASLELVFSDGTSFQASQNVVGTDLQQVGPAITNDLSQLATNTWYTRRFFLDGGGAWVGKTLSYAAVAFGGNAAGTYTAYFRNIYIQNWSTGVINLTIFSTTATAMQITPQQLQNSGYTSMTCAVVTTYGPSGFMESPVYSLANVGIVQNSQVSWVVNLPADTCVFLVTATIDGFATFLPCTSGSAIPNLLAGMSTTGRSLQFAFRMYNNGPDPTLTPVLTNIQGSVTSAYNCTKSDITAITKGTTAWSAGTLSNLNLSGSGTLQLNGYARDWHDANYGNQTLYGTASPNQGVLTKQFYLTTGTGADARSRLDFAGSSWQNFTAEVDIVLPAAGGQAGFVYRCTGWQNNNNTFAYSVAISTTQIQFGTGTNSSSGSGAFTALKTVSLTLSANTVYRLKIIVNGTTHAAYLNDVLMYSVTDSTYPGAGYLGLRFYNTSGSTQTASFINFGVMLALSGTWTSPAIDIHTLGIISNSQIIMQIDPLTVPSTVIFQVAISLNNGVSWTPCPNTLTTPVIAGVGNGQGYYQSLPVPGLGPGTNVSSYTQVRLQITITASTASTGLFMPDIQAISLYVIGAYSSTGVRHTAPLVWDSMQRLNVASGWGNTSSGEAYTQVGTGTTAVTSNEAMISNTSGDVHMVPTAPTTTDQEASARFQLSAATMNAGIELRYVDANNYYRLAAAQNRLSIVLCVRGLVVTLATAAPVITPGTWYRMHFRVVGSGPLNFYGNVWPDGTAEPTNWIVTATQ